MSEYEFLEKKRKHTVVKALERLWSYAVLILKCIEKVNFK